MNYLNSKSTNNLVPDLTIILNVSPEIGFKRLVTKEFGKKDRIEQEALDFFKRVNEGFLSLVDKFPERNIKVVDTDSISLETASKMAWEHIEKIMI
jgi:dTMP kinase